jgi:hypothetical protein
MWENIVQPGGPHENIRMRILDTYGYKNTHSENVIITAFQPQK